MSGVAEAAFGGDVIAAGGIGDAELVIRIGGDRIAVIIADGNDGPARIGMEEVEETRSSGG